MNTLLVGYDLNREGQNYKEIIKVLNGYGTHWHHLDSTWLIRTEETAIEVRDKLKKFIDGNDELLVINVTGDAAAWKNFSESGSKWLKKYLGV